MNEIFEFHITGDQRILEEGKRLGLKTIAIDLLKPDGSVLRSEYMTSHILKFQNFQYALTWMQSIIKTLQCDIFRLKIESPYYEKYVQQSKYIESHFEVPNFAQSFPVSRNQNKTKLLGTDREYNQTNYAQFRQLWDGKDIELCLYDDFVEEDADWFQAWKIVE